LRESIDSQVNALIEAIRFDALNAKTVEETIKQLVTNQVNEQIKLRQLRVQYDVLKRDAKLNDTLYQTILAKVKETDLSGRNKINNMFVGTPAIVPLRPIKPRFVLTLFLGVVGGLGVALGLAFFVNYLDDSIKSQDDVETYLRLPFLGYVPNIKT